MSLTCAEVDQVYSHAVKPSSEYAPNGQDLHTPGAKADLGKVRMGLVLGEFSKALFEVGLVGTLGAAKYTDNGWLEVPNGEPRYLDALMRHLNLHTACVMVDEETQLIHMAQVAWNALAVLELYLRRRVAPSEYPEYMAMRTHAVAAGEPVALGSKRA